MCRQHLARPRAKKRSFALSCILSPFRHLLAYFCKFAIPTAHHPNDDASFVRYMFPSVLSGESRKKADHERAN